MIKQGASVTDHETVEQELKDIAMHFAPFAAAEVLKTEGQMRTFIADHCANKGLQLDDEEINKTLKLLQQAADDHKKQLPKSEVPNPTPVEPELICLQDIPEQSVSWLWYPYIAKGKITIVQGDPGAGKTYLMAALTAIVTTGRSFPFEDSPEPRKPANVIFQNGEDGYADTIIPRLRKQGADLSRVSYINENKERWSMKDTERLDAILEDKKPALMIIDPLQAYLGAGVDMHRSNETRPVLHGIGMLAEKHGTAIIFVQHMNKAGGSNALYRNLGSIDIPAAARSVLMIGKNKNAEPTDGNSPILMMQIKNGLERMGITLSYEIGTDRVLRFTGQVSDATEADILMPAQIGKDGSQLKEASTIILNTIEDAPYWSTDLEAEVKELHGISKSTYIRARTALADAKKIETKKAPGLKKWYVSIAGREVMFEGNGNIKYEYPEEEKEPIQVEIQEITTHT